LFFFPNLLQSFAVLRRRESKRTRKENGTARPFASLKALHVNGKEGGSPGC